MPINSKHTQGFEINPNSIKESLSSFDHSLNQITRKNVHSPDGKTLIGQTVIVGSQDFMIYRALHKEPEQRSNLLLVLREVSNQSLIKYHQSILEQLVKEMFLTLKEIIEAGIKLNLDSAELLEVNLINVRLEVSAVNTKFIGSDLTCANLEGADLTGADFTRANLTRASMPKGWKDIVISTQKAVLNDIREV